MKKINEIWKRDGLTIILVVLGFILGAYFYPLLPDKVPIHWNLQGKINGYGSKLFGAFGLPSINLGMYLMFLVLSYIDPKGKDYDSFKSTYQFQKNILIVFVLGLQVFSLLISIGIVVSRLIFIQIMISLLLIFLGNVMSRVKYNYFVGIKTPWTLANEEVWRKTHRLAAPLWVIGGIVNILLSFMGITFNGTIFIAILIVITLAPIVYSYFAYRGITKR